jgi:hypothetical protein
MWGREFVAGLMLIVEPEWFADLIKKIRRFWSDSILLYVDGGGFWITPLQLVSRYAFLNSNDRVETPVFYLIRRGIWSMKIRELIVSFQLTIYDLVIPSNG